MKTVRTVSLAARVALYSAASGAVVAPLGAQAVRGTVVEDSTARRIDAVLVSLLDEKGKVVATPVRSDSNGMFVIRTKDRGRYRLQANRIGLQPVTTQPFDLALKSVIDVTIIMSRTAVVLSPLVVIANRPLTNAELMSTEGFEYRRRALTGFFYDTLDMRRSGYPALSSALKDFVPGLRTEIGFFGNEEIRMRVGGDNMCQPVLYRDGRRQVNFALTMLNTVRSQDYYGVEVYRRGSIPREFQMEGNECAVIAIWTKWHARPPNSNGPPAWS